MPSNSGGRVRDVDVEPRVALASLSGESDAAWARAASGSRRNGVPRRNRDRRGFATRGGTAGRARAERVPARRPVRVRRAGTRRARRRSGSSGGQRQERLARADPGRCRASAPTTAHSSRINAHCRQPELCAAGCGETLLRDAHRLCEYVETAADDGRDGERQTPSGGARCHRFLELPSGSKQPARTCSTSTRWIPSP